LHNTADTQPVLEPVKSEWLEEDHTADKGTTTPKKEAAVAWGGAGAVADEVRHAEAESSQAVGTVQGP
jgi:hypothetical protein